ncbi:MAG TPA: hypothetical protein VFZ49_00600 [Pyrinomonadaceae bacterium]
MRVWLWVLLLAVHGCATSNLPDVNTPDLSKISKIQSEDVAPDAEGKRPTFHETIDQAAASVGKQNLRKTALGVDDIEVRVWGGFGMTSVRGFLITRKGGVWAASSIEAEFNMPRSLKYKETALSEPARGWEAPWQSLLEHRLLTLPDAESIDCSAMYEDGYSYVVEIKKGKSYRTYMYDNPHHKFDNRCPEADEILAIANIIMNDYRLARFRGDY